MTQITVDENLARQLREGGGEVAICAPDGAVLGRFRCEMLAKLYAETKCPDSPEELERRKREESGRTLDEIIADLEAGR